MVNSVCNIHYFLVQQERDSDINLDFEVRCEFELPQISNDFICCGLHTFSVQHHWGFKENTVDHAECWLIYFGKINRYMA